MRQKSHLQATAAFTALWLVLVIATVSGLFETIENKLIDQAMRLRSEQTFRQDMLTIDIDDPSISDVGRWPWRWNIHRMMFDLLDRHNLRFIFVLDIDFSKKPPLSISPEEEAAIKKDLLSGNSKRIAERLKQSDPEGFILQTALMKEKVFFTSGAKIIDSGISDLEPIDLGEKKDNPEQSSDRTLFRPLDSIAPTAEQSFLSASVLIPPLKELLDNSRGAGVNGYLPDADGVVRRYPLLIKHRGRLYPSIALNAAMAMLQTETAAVRHGKVELSAKERILQIPVDRHGQVRVNWTGRYAASSIHVPFNLLSPFVVVQSLKDALRKIDLSSLQDPMRLHEMLIEHSSTLGLMKKEDSTNRATILFLAFLMEHYFNKAGYGVEETLNALGLDINNSDFLRIANQVYLNNNVLAIYNQDGKICNFEEALKAIESKPQDIDALRDSYEQLTAYIKNQSDMMSLRPLYFEPSKVLRSERGERIINPWIFKDKSVFYGLTATGLTSQNPSPYMERHPMLDLAPQVVNTILTGQFIQETPLYASICLISLCLGFVFFSALRTTPIKGFVIILGLILIHLAASWLLLSKAGLIAPVTPVLAALSSSYLCAVFIRYFKEHSERRRVRKIFSTMVSPEVLKIMEGRHNAISLTGEIREATVFSSDVSGFTNISEGVTAQELAQILNLYLTAMSNIIMSYDGYVDKYEGDAIKAVFGVPLPDEGHPWKACWASLAQQEELKIIQKMILLRYGVKVTARMGINTGIVYAGNMGSEKRLQYTVMGEAVRIAEELEPANKLFNSWIAAGDETIRRSQGFIHSRFLGEFESSEGTRVKAHEVISCEREQFLKYWQDRPVPELLLDSFKKLTPLRTLAWLDYGMQKTQDLDNPLLLDILNHLEGLRPEAMQYMKLQALTLYRSLHRQIHRLKLTFMTEHSWQIPKTKEPEDRILAIGLALERLVDSIKTHPLNAAEIEDALLEIDGLRKALESFRKRISLEAGEDAIASELRDYIKQMLLDEDTVALEADSHDLQRMSEIQSSIENKGVQLARQLKEKPMEFHMFSASMIAL